jgi:hypothetical protein
LRGCKKRNEEQEMVIAGDDVLDAQLDEIEPASRDGAINVMRVFLCSTNRSFPRLAERYC